MLEKFQKHVYNVKSIWYYSKSFIHVNSFILHKFHDRERLAVHQTYFFFLVMQLFSNQSLA